MLTVKDVSYSYGLRKILDGISFTAEDDEIVSILGPNGVGKTTLLKAVCGINRPQSGNAYVGDVDIYSLGSGDLARYIGYVPQSSPRSQISVFDMVLLGRKPYFKLNPTSKDLEMVSDILVKLDLDDLSLRYVTDISGGEFQKVQIARAMVQEPKVLVLDEPTNNLDIYNQHRTLGLIDDLVSEIGMCTVMTMHDINLATHYSDRMMFVKDGRVEAFGDPEIVTSDLVRSVYGMDVDVTYLNGMPTVVPRSCCRSRKNPRGKNAACCQGHEHQGPG